MTLADDYKRQFGWRSWGTILDVLPSLEGQSVLDLGCGVGDQAAALVARGARVTGFDMNEELLEAARAKGLANAEFHVADLRELPKSVTPADGIWCSFAAAYFPDLPRALATWRQHLKPGGWIALTEIDDLFGHAPLSDRTRSLLEGYARSSVRAARYDFHMGRRLVEHLEASDFTVAQTFTVDDRELAFQGPAVAGVVASWRARFDRMKLLRDFCGAEFARVRDEFLECLARSDHRSEASVWTCVATI